MSEWAVHHEESELVSWLDHLSSQPTVGRQLLGSTWVIEATDLEPPNQLLGAHNPLVYHQIVGEGLTIGAGLVLLPHCVVPELAEGSGV